MQLPKYKPLDWIVFKIDSYQGMGQIVSGQYDTVKDRWMYTVQLGLDKASFTVHQPDITHVLKPTASKDDRPMEWQRADHEPQVNIRF